MGDPMRDTLCFPGICYAFPLKMHMRYMLVYTMVFGENSRDYNEKDFPWEIPRHAHDPLKRRIGKRAMPWQF